MSVNKYHPHILVLPEDRANSQLANGFALEIRDPFTRRVQVLPEAGGWREVLSCFRSDHIDKMSAYSKRFLVLLIDFDGRKDRFDQARAVIPENLADRVFILGVWTEPEDLTKAGLGRSEAIGRAMAEDCRNDTDTIWGHDLLQHNASEIRRLREIVRPILFP